MTLDLLHHKVQLSLSVYGVVQLYNVWVVHLAEDLQFPDHTLLPLRVHQLVLVVHFHSQQFVRQLVLSLFDHCVSALTQYFTQSVLSYSGVVESAEFRILMGDRLQGVGG